MGSYPKPVNRGDLEMAIHNLRLPAEFTGNMIEQFDVEYLVQVICIAKLEVLDWKTATKAAHLYVAVDNNQILLIHFLRKFSERNELGFPLDQELWFVPSIINFRIV